jgi:phage protein D
MEPALPIPSPSGQTDVTFTIFLSGSPIPASYQVVSVETSSALRQAPHAEIVFRDGSPADRYFDIADSKDVSLGTRIEVRAGYRGRETSIFTGDIRQLSPQCSPTEASVLVITAAGPTAEATPAPDDTPVLRVTFGDSILSMNLQLDASGAARPARTRLRGEVSFQGSALATPGKTIQLDGIGRRFDGPALVGAVRHTIRDGVWTTFVTLGLPAA